MILYHTHVVGTPDELARLKFAAELTGDWEWFQHLVEYRVVGGPPRYVLHMAISISNVHWRDFQEFTLKLGATDGRSRD